MKDCRSTVSSFLILALTALPFPLLAAERIHASYAAPNASQSPLWVAEARGFFAKYGLDVDLIYISSGSLNVQALVGTTVQFAAGGPAALEARLRGPKLLTVANPLTVLASNLVTLPDIKSIEDLKGKIGGSRASAPRRIKGFVISFARTASALRPISRCCSSEATPTGSRP